MSPEDVKEKVLRVVNHRYFIVSLIVFAIVGTVITNACINIAVVAMTPPVQENKTVIGACPALEHSDDSENKNPQDPEDPDTEPKHRLRDIKYDWSESTKSLVFGSFFWSYIACLSFSGQIVQKFGSKWLISACLIGSCLIDTTVPFATKYLWLFLALRVCLGVLHSGCFPAAYDVIFNWVPLKERTICFALLDVANNIAVVTSYTTSGPLMKAYGWPALFWMPAILAGVAGFFATLGIKDKPPVGSEIDREMSDVANGVTNEAFEEEMTDTFDDKPKKSDMKTPFRAILTNRAVLASALFRFSGSWNFMIVMAKIPSYLKDIQREDISSNGFINAGMATLAGISLVINGSLSDVIINRGILSRTRTRKMFALFSGLSAATLMMCIPAAGCSTSTLHVILLLQAFGGGFGAGCDAALPSEMTTNFPAVTYAIVNTIALSAGFLTPLYAGLILDKIANQWTAWCVVFWSSGVFMICCTLLFQIFGSAERQPFDFVKENERPRALSIPMPPRKFSVF